MRKLTEQRHAVPADHEAHNSPPQQISVIYRLHLWSTASFPLCSCWSLKESILPSLISCVYPDIFWQKFLHTLRCLWIIIKVYTQITLWHENNIETWHLGGTFEIMRIAVFSAILLNPNVLMPPGLQPVCQMGIEKCVIRVAYNSYINHVFVITEEGSKVTIAVLQNHYFASCAEVVEHQRSIKYSLFITPVSGRQTKIVPLLSIFFFLVLFISYSIQARFKQNKVKFRIILEVQSNRPTIKQIQNCFSIEVLFYCVQVSSLRCSNAVYLCLGCYKKWHIKGKKRIW